MPTNKEILNKGLKYVVWALPLFFIGPTVINSAFKNPDHVMFVPVLGFGVLACLIAVILLFKGLKTIVNSQTDE